MEPVKYGSIKSDTGLVRPAKDCEAVSVGYSARAPLAPRLGQDAKFPGDPVDNGPCVGLL